MELSKHPCSSIPSQENNSSVVAIPLRDLCAGRVNSVLGPHMDSGRVIIIIPADGMALDAVCAIANKLDFALRLEDLGHMVIPPFLAVARSGAKRSSPVDRTFAC